MNNGLRKLINNIFTLRAWTTLGRLGYARYFASFLGKLPEIIRFGNLRPLDQAMSMPMRVFSYGGHQVYYDCRFADENIRDGSSIFGLIREILIRDCYFRYLPSNSLGQLETVVDLGANRGVFSILCAAFAHRILSVEALPEFKPVIEHQAKLNGFENIIAIETAMIGVGGALGAEEQVLVSLTSLLDKHDFDTVDLLKMDIEGSEFSLFKHPDWLPRVRRICMEVHKHYGEPMEVVDCLRKHGFTIVTADSNLRKIPPEHAVEFIYAWR